MTDQELAKRASTFQKEARDVRLLDIPGYAQWSERKLAEGTSGALIAHLDATCMWIVETEAADVDEATFEEMLAELEEEIGDVD